MDTDHPANTRAEALYTLCLLAAFADGSSSEQERAELKRIGETMLPQEIHPAALYQKVLLRQTDAAAAAQALDAPEWRQLAFEMAVKICEADGVTSPAEKRFLEDLGQRLQLSPAAARDLLAAGDEMAAAPIDPLEAEVLPALPAVRPQAGDRKAEVDPLVLKYSLLNGALELLPETMATLAIIPLQIKLVNSVGKLHGISMDRRQITEFIGAAGIGATSQVVEGFAVKMMTGLAGKFGKQLLGKTGGSLAKGGADQITSSAFSFASTWAIGQLADRYYANGRSWAGIDAKASIAALKNDAQALHQQYLPNMREQAGSLNLQRILSMVRGTP